MSSTTECLQALASNCELSAKKVDSTTNNQILKTCLNMVGHDSFPFNQTLKKAVTDAAIRRRGIDRVELLVPLRDFAKTTGHKNLEKCK